MSGFGNGGSCWEGLWKAAVLGFGAVSERQDLGWCLGFPGHFTPPSLSEGGEGKLKSEKVVGLLDFFETEFCQLSSFLMCS